MAESGWRAQGNVIILPPEWQLEFFLLRRLPVVDVELQVSRILLNMGLNIFEPKTKFKRSPSLHQKQMRRWTVALIIVGIVAFTAIFYFLNKHWNRVAL